MFSADANSPRWYVLSYLGTHRDALKRLSQIDLPYFAPEFFAQESARGTRQDYLQFCSYAFIQGTQNQIYELKRQTLRSFNFLPKCQGTDPHHPFVEDYVIQQLHKVEETNNGKIPFMPYPTDVVVGDTILILSGEFEGQKAKAVTKNGSKYRQIILDIAGTFIIPLCKLKVGEYEIIGYNSSKKKTTTSGIRASDTAFLQEALGRHHCVTPSDEAQLSADSSHAQAIALHYHNINPDSHQQRIRITALLAMAYTIIGDKDKQRHYVDHTIKLLTNRCSAIQKADTYCTLYGCTLREDFYNHYLTAKDSAKECKDMKSITKISNQMNIYRQWNKKVHPLISKRPLICKQTAIHWFAIETSSSTDELSQQFTRNGITTFNPSITSKNGKAILLVLSTFSQLREIHSSCQPFAFITETVNGHDTPLYYTRKEIEAYRHLLTTKSEDIEHLPLSPDHEELLIKAKRSTITIQGKQLTGIISNQQSSNQYQQRFIIHLRHLDAIAVAIRVQKHSV